MKEVLQDSVIALLGAALVAYTVWAYCHRIKGPRDKGSGNGW
jgi:hypothetical protein